MKTIHILFKREDKKAECFYSEDWKEYPEAYKLYGLKAAIKKLQEEYNKQKLLTPYCEAADEEVIYDNEDFVSYV